MVTYVVAGHNRRTHAGAKYKYTFARNNFYEAAHADAGERSKYTRVAEQQKSNLNNNHTIYEINALISASNAAVHAEPRMVNRIR